MNMNNIHNLALYPCESGLVYAVCCNELHSGRVLAQTALELTRSRYSAFALGNADYLVESRHLETWPASLSIDESQHWIGLKIKTVSHGRTDEDEGSVEFVTRYKVQGKAYRLHENSRFRRLNGRWYYLDGERPD